jgi:hypothetical protein
MVDRPLCRPVGYGSPNNAQLVQTERLEELPVKIFKWLVLISFLFALPVFLMKFIKRTGTDSDRHMRYDIDDYVAEEL